MMLTINVTVEKNTGKNDDDNNEKQLSSSFN